MTHPVTGTAIDSMDAAEYVALTGKRVANRGGLDVGNE